MRAEIEGPIQKRKSKYVYDTIKTNNCSIRLGIVGGKKNRRIETINFRKECILQEIYGPSPIFDN